jgi:adenosine deaminase
MPISTIPFASHPGSRLSNAKAASPPGLRFQRSMRPYGTTERIEDDFYKVFTLVPKSELHIHESGSSSLAVLSEHLQGAIEGGNLDWFPVYSGPNTGPTRWVRFKDAEGRLLQPFLLRSAIEETLNPDNLRRHFRFDREAKHRRKMMDSEEIAETTAKRKSNIDGDEWVTATEPETLQARKQEALNAYRLTSNKINPYVKNNRASYMNAHDYAMTLPSENVRYTEYRVSPSGNGIGGAKERNIEDVLSSVYRGFEHAQQYMKQRSQQLDYGLIVLFERQGRSPDERPNLKVERAEKLAESAVRLKKEGKYNICGVDLAGDEARNTVTPFKPAFDIIKSYDRNAPADQRLGITIHAGETPMSQDAFDTLTGAQSIEKAIDLAWDESGTTPVRIGHGLQIINCSEDLRKAFQIYQQHPEDWEQRINIAELRKNSPLLDKVIKRNIVLEMCPKSNIQTYGIHPGFPDEQIKVKVRQKDYSKESYSRHPAVFLLRLGVKVAISSDNRTISNTDVTNEFVKLFKYSNLTYSDLKQMVLNGFEGAFTSPEKKKAILQDVRKQFAAIEQDPHLQTVIQKMGMQDTGEKPLPPFPESVFPAKAPAKTMLSQPLATPVVPTAETPSKSKLKPALQDHWQQLKLKTQRNMQKLHQKQSELSAKMKPAAKDYWQRLSLKSREKAHDLHEVLQQ